MRHRPRPTHEERRIGSAAKGASRRSSRRGPRGTGGPSRDPFSAKVPGRACLYVEGAGDRGILRAWSYRLLPVEGPALFRNSVILGGRRPERAIEHFAHVRGQTEGARGLCILDRDDEHAWAAPEVPDLAFFTWSRRHIESYLLVPDAVLRVIGPTADGPRVLRALRDHLPDSADEAACRLLDAKRLLGPTGPVARALGRPLPLTRIARATREEELHPDVLQLFERLRQLAER